MPTIRRYSRKERSHKLALKLQWITLRFTFRFQAALYLVTRVTYKCIGEIIITVGIGRKLNS